ncbi:MAG: biosynthetic arginine decarboxylase [Phycisphaerales bacterium]
MTTFRTAPAIEPGEPDHSPRPQQQPEWTIADARELYMTDAWGNGYFNINEQGHVIVTPEGDVARSIDLREVVEGLRERDLSAPLMLRFSDVLAHRIRDLHDAFASAIEENAYQGSYRAVYPIKVNQQRQLVNEIFQHGKPFGFGLEVGSKPELLAAMAVTRDDPDRLIICNGFKDDRYIEAVILATKLGRRIIPVVEGFNELGLVIKYARLYNVEPRIGVRVKLASQGAGRWRESAGVKSKFGLFVSEVLAMVRVLREHDMLNCLKLVHCHVGSQVHDIRHIKDAINELAHIYAELKSMGTGLEYIDVGGGLGVDYDGSRSNFESSMNYSLREYAADVVYRIGSVCSKRDLAHPTIISESGRAMVAYNSVLVVNVLGSSRLDRTCTGMDPSALSEDAPQPLRDLREAWMSVSESRLLECYHDAVQARDEALNLFNLGYITLEDRGLAEQLFWATCARVHAIARTLEGVPEDLMELETILCDTYFCNFSLFQSLPDSWAIDQLFPIMPIHRLDEQPTRRGLLADITCDSDGKIDRFIAREDVAAALDLHELREHEDYYLGIFLVGAYQETLGDLHNLFGDTHVVHISLDENGDWVIDEVIRGDRVGEVLGYVQFDAERLYPVLARDCEQAVRDRRMTVAESQALLRFYESSLNSYTYLEPQER